MGKPKQMHLLVKDKYETQEYKKMEAAVLVSERTSEKVVKRQNVSAGIYCALCKADKQKCLYLYMCQQMV